MNSLLSIAREYSKKSHSPYSQFSVGAAVSTPDGEIYGGANIENASLGLAMCAERVAIFRAIMEGCSTISQVAISCPDSTNDSGKFPCGACLQVISEFAEDEAVIFIDGVGEFKLTELLKHPFKL